MERTRVLGIAARVWTLAVVAFGIVTLPHYGLTCDEALGNMFFGERYAHYFATFDRRYLDFELTELAIHKRAPNLALSPWHTVPAAFPPLADTLAGASAELFGHRLRWLDPVDAFHLPTVLLAGVLLWVLYTFAERRFGAVASLLAVVMLGAFPRFWGDMHNNPKDIPEAVFFSLTVMALAYWHERPGWTRALVAGALGGAALAVKINAVFVPAVAVLGLWRWPRGPGRWAQVAAQRRSAAHYALMLGVACVVFVAVWPWLYASPVDRLKVHLAAFLTQGHRAAGQGWWNWDPLVQVVATTPEVVLAFLVIGMAVAAWEVWTAGPRAGALRLALAWMLVPLLRASAPGTVNFDGIRHFAELLPPVALLAGTGGAWVIEAAGRRRVLAAAGTAAALAANLGLAIARYHPYEALYYNTLVGGLRGAQVRHGFAEATDYWGSSYREGAGWLVHNAPAGSALYVPVFPWVAQVPAGLWLPDVDQIEKHQLTVPLAEGRPLYVMFVTRAAWYDAVARHCETMLRPVHEVVVDGAGVMRIYRIDHLEQLPARFW